MQDLVCQSFANRLADGFSLIIMSTLTQTGNKKFGTKRNEASGWKENVFIKRVRVVFDGVEEKRNGEWINLEIEPGVFDCDVRLIKLDK